MERSSFNFPKKSSCRICFTTEKLKLLCLFSVKIDERTLAQTVTFLSGIEVSFGRLLNTSSIVGHK